MLLDMYPSTEVLAEIGRVTVAGSRLDIWLGFLWSNLDRNTDENKVRKEAGANQQDHIRKLARSRLHGTLKENVLAVVDIADAARKRRNQVVHQDWVLRGPDATRSVRDFVNLSGPELEAYRTEWEREAKESDDWQRVPHDSVQVVPAQKLDELRELERALANATDLVTTITFTVASARDAGAPEGWLDPADWADYRTPPRVTKDANS